ncbi:hypothetical protein cypCar_00044796 [Cyprinus carpio]|nr:hypothetical protein cypCar_00044796 [Cyprinus carpio]
MLNGSREGLFELGKQLQQEGDSKAALHCFLSCLLGLTHVQSFHSLPNCLHQIAEIYIDDKNWSQEEGTLGTSGCLSQEELSEQASQAQDLERLAQLCIMSKRPHLALEYSGKATKIHQRAFGNDHPITARSLELLATVYAEIGKTEYTSNVTMENFFSIKLN